MQGGLVSYGLLAALATALLAAACTDLRRREIDNGLNAAVALGAPLFWYSSGMSLAEAGWQIVVAAGTFVVLAALFAARTLGGGDVKLLTALALWIKPFWFLRLLFVMALAGGVLTLGFVVWHFIRRNRERIAIPYGIAISFAGLWALASQYLSAFVAGARLG
jgi:prepilin peptidase CpaA